jgi:hypothetical protein
MNAHYDRTGLTCKLFSNGGMPIVSKLAKKLPTLSRRNRRELARQIRKTTATATPAAQ